MGAVCLGHVCLGEVSAQGGLPRKGYALGVSTKGVVCPGGVYPAGAGGVCQTPTCEQNDRQV